jgi:acetylornithine deacetylase
MIHLCLYFRNIFIKKRIFMSGKAANINYGRLKTLLTDMIDIYSPSGKETQLADYLQRYFKKNNIRILPQLVDEGRHNLLLLPENENAQLIFVGHIDTVPAYELDNYKSYEDDDDIYGLGSCDMKSGCAAMIEAFIAYHEAFPDTDFPAALALVVGEEDLGDGSEMLISEYHYPWAIVGEPTDLKPCLGHYGYAEATIHIKTERKHAAEADKDTQSVSALLKTLVKITDYLDSEKHDIVYNIRNVNSSQAGFAAPEWAEAVIDLHLPPQYPIGAITIEIEEMLSKSLAGTSLLAEDILRFYNINSGYQLPEKGFLPNVLKTVYSDLSISWEADSFKSASDANILWNAGIKPIVLGPGQLSKAHSSNESVPFSQVMAAADIYLKILSEI